MTDEPITSNSRTVFRQLIDEIVELERENIALGEDAKEYKGELKEKGFPAARLVALQRELEQKDEADRKEARATDNIARALLGQPALIEGAHDTVVAKDDSDFAKLRLKSIMQIFGEIKVNKGTIKEKYDALKAAGFVVAAAKKIVQFQVDDEALKTFNDNNALIDTYLDVYNGATP